MAQSNNVISSIKLPNGQTYEIRDETALHSIADLGLAGVLQFKGVVATKDKLPTINNRVGDVYHVIADDYEYVWATINGVDQWEEFGAPHDFVGTEIFAKHKHSVTASGTVPSHSASGKIIVPTVQATITTVGGTAAAPTLNTSSDKVLGEATQFTTEVSGKGLGTVTKQGIKVTVGTVAVTGNGTATAITAISAPTATFLTGVTPATTSVINGVTPATGVALTGLGTPTTDSAIATLSTTSVKSATPTTVTFNAISSKTDGTASKIATGTKTIPNVTGNVPVTVTQVTSTSPITATKITSYGTAASWKAEVTNGVLVFTWEANTVPRGTDVTASKVETGSVGVSKVTLGTAISVTEVTSNTDVPVSKVETAEVTASQVSVTPVVVATGAQSYVDAITAITPDSAVFVTSVTADTTTVINSVTPQTGSAVKSVTASSTATVLTGVKVSTQPTVDLELVNEGAGQVDIVTGVGATSLSAKTTAGTNDLVQAITGVTATTSAVTLDSQVATKVTTGTAEIDVNVVATPVTVTVAGSTDIPQ